MLAEHAELTLTGLYNALEKLRAGQPLTAKEKIAHDKGLVAVLKSLHDDLDLAVLDAYGWHDNPDEAAILERLVALNAERAREEAAGTIRWLRPDFQAPRAPKAQDEGAGSSRPRHSALSAANEGGTTPLPSAPLPQPDTEDQAPAARTKPATAREPWPAALPEQIAAVARVLAESAAPLDEAAIAARFTGKGPWKKRLPQLLDTLAALGKAREVEDGRWMG